MHVAIIGGKLQGLEAVYLAKKAGWQTLLIDKRANVPAAGICDYFYQVDVNDEEKIASTLLDVDLVIPALENRQVLQGLAQTMKKLMIPLALDLHAYDISSSKKRSDHLFAEIGIPAPSPWPNCSFPVIAKPSGASGSEGVLHFQKATELELFQKNLMADLKDWVIQEFLEGPSYSLEIVGWSGKYKVFQVTALEFDQNYDCKRVRAPVNLAINLQDEFADIALKLARKLNLNGIMDVEVILHREKLKVLEIDARLPSQTPTAVYHSTGINMLEVIGSIYTTMSMSGFKPFHQQKAVVYEHIAVEDDTLTVAGEHVISTAGPLFYIEGFFGADEALTNYSPGKKTWVATLINTGSSKELVDQKRESVINRILSELKISSYIDPNPVVNNMAQEK